MAVNYAFKKGIDLPKWVWLTQVPIIPLISGGLKYDGTRYIYLWASAGLYRFDTYSNGWQFLATPGVGVAGQDIVYDNVRNVLISIVTATTWQVFNLNSVAVTVAGVACTAWAITTMTPILPVAISGGAGLAMARQTAVGESVRTGIAGAVGQTTTNVNANDTIFYPQMIGLMLRVTSGAQNGLKRLISAWVDASDVTLVSALPGALTAADTFVIEAPNGTATAGAVGTLTDTGQAFIVNKYTNWDVEIMSGTGVGQRRRIASNTATVLTVAGAVTGNPRTGNFALAPDATSVYRIVPSTDFLYFNTVATPYKLDVVATPAAAWVALAAPPGGVGTGSFLDFNRKIAPGHLYMPRGAVTGTIYVYDIGLNTWTTLVTFGLGIGTFTTGSCGVSIDSRGKFVMLVSSSTQLLVLDYATLQWDVCGNHPYAPGTPLEGKRMESVISPDGAQFIYIQRPGGQEFFRAALEWL